MLARSEPAHVGRDQLLGQIETLVAEIAAARADAEAPEHVVEGCGCKAGPQRAARVERRVARERWIRRARHAVTASPSPEASAASQSVQRSSASESTCIGT